MSDFAKELAQLQTLTGASFIAQLKLITMHREFHLLEGENNIFIAGGESGQDFNHLLNAAHKAVELGYRVYILPNPKGIRSADFIFEKKGIFKLYDLKTIHGKASASNRLRDSIGQTNRVLLNIRCKYDSRILAVDIKEYFSSNANAIEVLIFKGRKSISINRYQTASPLFFKEFRKRYET